MGNGSGKLAMRRHVRFGNLSIRLKIGIIVFVGLVGIASAISLLMFSTANSLFERGGVADLRRQNQIVADSIDNLTAKAASDLLLARQNPAFNQYYLSVGEDVREQSLENIQTQMMYLNKYFSIDEICLINGDGSEAARSVRETLAEQDDLADDEQDNPFFLPTMALAEGEVYRSPVPYLSDDVHRWVVAHATPIYLPGGQKVGLLHFEIPLDWFAEKVNSSGLDGSFSFLMTRDGRMLVHPQIAQFRKSAGINNLNPDTADFPSATALGGDDFRRLIQQMQTGQSGRGSYSNSDDTFEVVYKPVFGGNWIMGTVLPHSVIYRPATELRERTLLIALPFVLFVLALLMWYSAKLFAPLKGLTKSARAIAYGDVNQDICVSGRDEIGLMAEAFRDMVAYLKEIAATADAIAVGDLTVDTEPKSSSDHLGKSFKRMILNLRNVVGEVQMSADFLADASKQLRMASARTEEGVQEVTRAIGAFAADTDGAKRTAQRSSANVARLVFDLVNAIQSVAKGAADQAQQVQAVSATAMQMAEDAKRVAAKATQVSVGSLRMKESAMQGTEAVRDTIKGMVDIEATVTDAVDKVVELDAIVRKIGAVVDTIDEIADQTSLLALNAAIEAARAGQHGAGFAVVADEVRKLAERSQHQTKEVADLITQVQARMRIVVEAMHAGSEQVTAGTVRADNADNILSEIVKSIETTVDQIGDIARGADGMEAEVFTVLEAMQSISAVVQENSAATEQMSEQAEGVRQSVGTIEVEAERNACTVSSISESAKEMRTQVEGIKVQTEELEDIGHQLREMIVQFEITFEGLEDPSCQGAQLGVPLQLVPIRPAKLSTVSAR